MESTHYYYRRDAENKPIITVCLLEANDSLARGVAICSLSDNPCKKTGRTLARHRALRAMKKKCDSCAVHRSEAYAAIYGMEITNSYLMKSKYNPQLTKSELKLLV